MTHGMELHKEFVADPPLPPLVVNLIGDRIKSWGGIGALWGGVCGLLLAPTSVLPLPGLSLVSNAGPVAVSLIGALEGSIMVGSLLVLGAILTRSRQSKVSPGQA